jgi:hypothetical protein
MAETEASRAATALSVAEAEASRVRKIRDWAWIALAGLVGVLGTIATVWYIAF